MLKVSKIFFVVCIILSLFFSASALAVFFGDKAFREDNIAHAKNLYTLAVFLNPINKTIQNRLQAATVTYTERTEESEENSDYHAIALGQTPNNVLGIASCIPVLMYHYIRVNPWPIDTVGFGLSTPPQTFAEELDYYKSKGYTTITLSDLKKVLEYSTYLEIKDKEPPFVTPPTPPKLPPKPIIITLDDGYEDAYTQAYPLLKQRNMEAVSFVITGFVGLPNYLTWDEISEMDKSGVFDMESHTVHHYALTHSDDKTLMNELTQSKKDLEDHLKKPVPWIAYPYGNVNDHVEEFAKKAGYFGAFGTSFGAFQDTEFPGKFALTRVRVSGGDWGPSVVSRIEQAVTACK